MNTKLFKFITCSSHHDEQVITPFEIHFPADTKFALSAWDSYKVSDDINDLEKPYNIWTILVDPDSKYTEISKGSNINVEIYHFDKYTLIGFNNVYVPKTYLTSIDEINNKIKWDNYVFIWYSNDFILKGVSKIKKALSANGFEYQKIDFIYNDVLDTIDTYISTSCIKNTPENNSYAYIKEHILLDTEESHKIYDTLLAYAINEQTGQKLVQYDEEYFKCLMSTDYVIKLIMGYKNISHKVFEDIAHHISQLYSNDSYIIKNNGVVMYSPNDDFIRYMK